MSMPYQLNWYSRHYHFVNHSRIRASLNFIRVLFICFFLSVLPVSCGNETAQLSGILPIDAPSIVVTGTQIEVRVGPVEANNGTPIGLVAVGTYGPRVYHSEFQSGEARFLIPADDTRQPGYLALIVAADDARGNTSVILFSDPSSSAQHATYRTEGGADLRTAAEDQDPDPRPRPTNPQALCAVIR